MQKILSLLLIILFNTSLLYSQAKNDYTWILGYPTSIPEMPNTEDFGGMFMKFTDKGYAVEKFDIFGGPISAVANDDTGNLLFYTNGCSIYSKEHKVMENGDEINLGASNYDYECDESFGIFYIRSGNMTLPMPGHSDRHFLLHLRLIETSDTNPYDLLNDRLLFSEVDVTANDGLGKVIQKNQTVVADSLHDAISAVRHGNGRDWWVVMPRGRNRAFWKILLTPEGFQGPVLQTFPPPYFPYTVKYIVPTDTPPLYEEEVIPDEYGHECWAGQAIFSPDGSKYCRVIKAGEVEVYDFDRCSGELTLRRVFSLPPYQEYPEFPVQACGLAISPNNRYLYFNNNEALYQFDLFEENLESGPYELIEEWDRYLEEGSFASNFFQMRNAPDGKIYMNGTNGNKSLHVIHEPNKQGKACQFEQRGADLPRWAYFVINYFPNFRLYDLADSPCDTLGIDDPNSSPLFTFEEFKVFPNPANKEVILYVPQCEGIRVQIWNIAGQLVLDIPFIAGMEAYRLDVSDWSSGAYIIAAYIDAREPIIQKLIVVH